MEDFDDITEKIIGAAYKVSNTLGVGFLEKVYENALFYELFNSGITVKQQFPIKIYYHNQNVGEYYVDLMVENQVVVELKAAKGLDPIHYAQLMNYLKACNIRCGLLLNFGRSKVEVKRILNGY